MFSAFLIIFLNLFISWAQNAKDKDVREGFSSFKNKCHFIKGEIFHPGTTPLI